MYRAKYRATKMYHPIYYQDQKASISYRMKYEYLIQSELKCPNIVLIFYQQGILIPNNTRKLALSALHLVHNFILNCNSRSVAEE